MSTDFLKKYIDIINEAEQPRVQLDEDSPYSKKQINWVIKYNMPSQGSSGPGPSL
jgi:hypothetical protein